MPTQRDRRAARRSRQRAASASAPAAPRRAALSPRDVAAAAYNARVARSDDALRKAQRLGIAVHAAHAEFLDPKGLADIETLRSIFPAYLGPNDFAPRMRRVAQAALDLPTQEMVVTAAVVGTLGLSTTVPDLSRYGISFPNITALEVAPTSFLRASGELTTLATQKLNGISSLRAAMNIMDWLVKPQRLEDGDLLLPESPLTERMRREAVEVIKLPEGPQKDAERRDWFDAYGSLNGDRIRAGAGLVLAGLVLFAPPQTSFGRESL